MRGKQNRSVSDGLKTQPLSGATELQINQEWEAPNFSQQEGLSVGVCGLGQKTEEEKCSPGQKTC